MNTEKAALKPATMYNIKSTIKLFSIPLQPQINIAEQKPSSFHSN